MIIAESESSTSQVDWQANFVAMLPSIEQYLRGAFCRLDRASMDEAIGEGVAHSLLAYVRLHQRGLAEVASPSTLAFYSAKRVRCGRPAVGRMNSKDPLSRYAQITKGVRVERLGDKWVDDLVEDKRATVHEQVAAKLDVHAWLSGLSQRMRQIATELALGFSTAEVARKHGVSASRISQLRRSLENSWATFQQNVAPASAY